MMRIVTLAFLLLAGCAAAPADGSLRCSPSGLQLAADPAGFRLVGRIDVPTTGWRARLGSYEGEPALLLTPPSGPAGQMMTSVAIDMALPPGAVTASGLDLPIITDRARPGDRVVCRR